MRTFLLLALTFVAVNGSQPDPKKILLEEIIGYVNHIQNDSSVKNLNQFVKNIFQSQECADNNLCQAAMVLKNMHLKDRNAHLTHMLQMLRRSLFAYADLTGHRTCSITASEEHPVGDFLNKIKDCCQSLLSKLVSHPKKAK